MIGELLNKNNLHHAYLFEGGRDAVLADILEFLHQHEILDANSPDLIQIHVDSFRMEDARKLKDYSSEKSYSDGKKIFLISANSILLEAQNSLLKIFEEPIDDTHFFVIVPDANSLLKTLVSRFQFISTDPEKRSDSEVKQFLAIKPGERIEFLKSKLAKFDAEDEEAVTLDSARSEALKFLNQLEYLLHQNGSRDGKCYEQIFKVREILRMPGSSVKNLLESVALIAPVIY